MKESNILVRTIGILSVLLLIGMMPIFSDAKAFNFSQSESDNQTETLPSQDDTRSAEVCAKGDEDSGVNYEKSSNDSSVNLQEAYDLIERWLSCDQVNQFEFKALDESEYDQETFIISSGSDNRIVIEATSTSALLMGWNWYMKYEANANISFNGKNVNLSEELPMPSEEIERQANVENRFALNDTDEGYTDPYADWEEWQRKIDILAIHGINEVLVYPGQEAVYQKTFEEFGYSKSELREWIPGPAHQPWWLMQNLSTFPRVMPQEVIDKRAELGEKISDRLRDLGMTPVFPGYYGMVPFKFEERNPDAEIVSQGTYHTFQQPDWLDTTNKLYSEIAATFYEHQSDLFGDTDMFKMDLFHEGGKEGGVDVGEASIAVQEALNKAHPDATWVLLGWHSNPRIETLEAVDKEKVLVLDGISDRDTAKNREKDWKHTPYAFGTIWNFGGHTNMAANLTIWNEKFYEWLDKEDSALSGTALLPEAINNNPYAVEFFTEMAWHEEPLDLDEWTADYVKARYGASDSNAIKAWQTIQETLYNLPGNNSSEYATELYSLVPDIDALNNSRYFQKDLHYNKAKFEQALEDLLAVDSDLQDSSAYQYDLMDVTRQVLANRGRILLPEIEEAYHERDKELFDELSDLFLHYIDLTDQVTATNYHSMLGPWLKKAENWASSEERIDQLKYDAKSLITIWTPQNSLNDYARRQLSGLTGDYYYSRWESYFDTLDAALETKTAPKSIDWYEFGEEWVNQSGDFPTEPEGNIVDIANDVYNELAIQSIGELEVTSDQKVFNKDNKKATIKGSFTNKNGLSDSQDVELSLDVPDGFTVESKTETSTDKVGAGEEFTVEWEVTASDNPSKAATEHFTVNANYESNGESQTLSEDIIELVENEVTSPFKTVTFNESTFSQSESGDELAIYGGGEDWWKSTDEYGAIYKEDGFESFDTATAKVEHQDETWGYARAGLVARNDITDDSAGYINMSVTPENGCILSWDSNGDGKLNKSKEASGFSAPAYVKLSRDGSTFTGSCSKDGQTWTEVGTAEVADVNSTQDIGLAMSAANRHTEEMGVVNFNEFEVEPQMFSLDLPHKKIPNGIPVNINAVFENVLDHPLENMDASLDVPGDWEVEEITSEKSEVAPGEKAEMSWKVIAPDDAEFSRYNVRASTNFEVDGEIQVAEDAIPIELVFPTSELAESFNNVGITDEDNPDSGNLDGKMSFSAQSLAEKGFTPGAIVTHDGMAFEWPDVAAGDLDNVAGQAAIRKDVKGDKLSFIGTAVGASSSDQKGTGSIIYSDGSVEEYTIKFANYYAGHNPSKNSVVAVDGRNRPSGPVNAEFKYQFLYDSVSLDPDKEVAAVVLPDKSSLHVFSMSTTQLSAADIKEQVESLQEREEIKDDDTVHALNLHLTAVEHYEKSKAKEKVIKHMRGFKKLLEHQKHEDLISEEAFNKLSTDADYLIEKWQ